MCQESWNFFNLGANGSRVGAFIEGFEEVKRFSCMLHCQTPDVTNVGFAVRTNIFDSNFAQNAYGMAIWALKKNKFTVEQTVRQNTYTKFDILVLSLNYFHGYKSICSPVIILSLPHIVSINYSFNCKGYTTNRQFFTMSVSEHGLMYLPYLILL